MPSWRFFILLVLLTLCQSGVRVKSMTTWVRRSDARNLLQDIEKDVCNGLWFDFRYLIGRTYESLYGPYVLFEDEKTTFKPLENASFCSILSFAGVNCDPMNELEGINRIVDSNQCSLIFKYLQRHLNMHKINRWLELSSCAAEMHSTEVVGDKNLEMVKFELSRHMMSYLVLDTDVNVPLLCGLFHSLVEDPDLELIPKDQDVGVCNKSGSYACAPKDWRWCDNATSSEKSSVEVIYSDLLQSQLQNVRDKIQQSVEKSLRSLVDDAFSWVLERDPSEQEEDSLVALLQQGKDFKYLVQYLHSTKEYRIKCAAAFCTANSKKAVDNVFHEVLLRPADPVALRRYTDMLHDGFHTTTLRKILKESEEYKTLCLRDGLSVCDSARSIVRMMYLKVLGRHPDLGGLTAYSRQLVLGKFTESQLQNELEKSDEFVNGAGLRRKALSIVETLKRGYQECSDARFTENPYWNGRWCDRSGCDDNSSVPCTTFPLEMYAQTEMELAGVNPSLPASEVRKFEELVKVVTEGYVRLLGRYPDRGFLISNMGKYMTGEASTDGLHDQLLSSQERQDNLQQRSEGTARAGWIDKINILSKLMIRYNLSFPEEVAHCFRFQPQGDVTSDTIAEFMDSSTSDGKLPCHSIGKVLSTLQEAWNQHGPLLGLQQEEEPMLPIAMYVNERPQYFLQVVRSLQAVHNIRKVAAIVISMDSVKEEMLDIALSIDFAPFRIIFHPVNEDLLKNQPLLAIKLHWIWLQDMLWNNIAETRGWKGDIALLEEDHVVSSDYLDLLSHLVYLKQHHCPRCWGVTLRWACMHSDDEDGTKVCRSHSVINTGIAFNRSTYLAIKNSNFDLFADGWDWSLFHLAQTGQMPPMMIGPALSRVRNVGREGVTVTEKGDEFLQRQLEYAVAKNSQDSLPLDHLWIDKKDRNQFTPPMWEPLYLGAGIGFLAPQA